MASLSSLTMIRTKSQLDHVIRSVRDVVLVLRFGKENDVTCLHLDNIVSINLNKFDIYCYGCNI